MIVVIAAIVALDGVDSLLPSVFWIGLFMRVAVFLWFSKFVSAIEFEMKAGS
jgi:hypothetical protein